MANAQGLHNASDRVVGGNVTPLPPAPTIGINASIYDTDGNVLWSSGPDLGLLSNNVIWPAPLTAAATSITDRPRFYVPPWAVTPIPKGQYVDPALIPTNGYDFRNDVSGDTYVFLLGSFLEDWYSSRQEFLTLTGHAPLLPDFILGTAFTYWYSCTWCPFFFLWGGGKRDGVRNRRNTTKGCVFPTMQTHKTKLKVKFDGGEPTICRLMFGVW